MDIITGRFVADGNESTPKTAMNIKTIELILFYFLPAIGFFLAFILLVRLPRQQNSTSTTIAWVLVIFLLPYLGVPLYLFLGGRKVRKMIQRKRNIEPSANSRSEELYTADNPFFTSNNAIFPPRRAYDTQLIGKGDDAFRILMETIYHAQQSIYITTFILGDDPTGKAIVAALAHRARHGVSVHLLLDALGSRSIGHSFFEEFKNSGGQYAFFMPMLRHPFMRGRANLRNHRKMAIIDSRIALIGGMNLSENYMGSSTGKLWKDLSYMVEGDVVADLCTVFKSDWEFAANSPAPIEYKLVGTNRIGQPSIKVQLVPSGPDIEGDPLHDAILTAIFSAKKRVWIVTPYFIPDEMVIKALCVAARRNIDVSIIVPRWSNHRFADFVRRSYLRHCARNGVKVYLYEQGMIHGKVILIDDGLSILGSMNMDMRSFFLNYEIALFIESESTAHDLTEWIQPLMRNCRQSDKPVHIIVESIEGIAQLLAPLL